MAPVGTLDDLRESLREEGAAPLYLFYGEEGLLIDEALEMVIRTALPETDRAFNLDVLSASEVDAREIVDHASLFPMMGERRVVLVREIDRLAEKELEVLAHYTESPSPSTCLILVGSRVDLRRKAFAAARKAGTAFEFRPLYENQLPSWIENRVISRGLTIAGEASRLLAAYVGSSLREIDNEIEKLSLFLGDRKTITEADVASVVGLSREFSVFELQKAIGERNIARAVERAEHLLEAGEPMPLIVSILTNYFATLWRIGDLLRRGMNPSEIPSRVRVNPYYLKEYLATLRAYSLQEIEEAFDHLSTADEQSKTTGADLRSILHRFLLNVILPGQVAR
jgi:DNA polymerase-3 subunit delta